jgi:tetratricopeptide (TPR) repeat protein
LGRDIIILLILSSVGALGGCLAAMQKRITSFRFRDKVTCLHMLQGTAGAIIIVTLSPVDPFILSAPFASDQSTTQFAEQQPTGQLPRRQIEAYDQQLFIKLIALALIGGFAGGSLLETSARQWVKRMDHLEQRQDSLEEEQRKSLDAVRDAEKILHGLSLTSSELAHFEVTLREASSRTRFDIWNRADEVRREHWQNDKKRLERSLLIFKALLKTEDAKSNHWWYASVGYCLKDQPQPDYQEALRYLNDAIKFRGKEVRSGAYEFNRAYCYITLDLASQDNPQYTKQIHKDLDAAASRFDRFRDIINTDPVVKQWREVNAQRAPKVSS